MTFRSYFLKHFINVTVCPRLWFNLLVSSRKKGSGNFIVSFSYQYTVFVADNSSRCTYEHSGIDETHISFETNCLLHLNITAFSGIRYDLIRSLNPLPQVTEQLDQAVYSVVWHSAENNKQNNVK